MDLLPADSPGSTSGKTIELAQRALSANQELQYELTVRAEELEEEIREADRLLEALENGNDPKEAEDEIQIPGARRASSLFPLSECLNQTSPLYEEAKKRMEFVALITPRSFNPKQLEALRNAVCAENTKLQAYRTQAGNTDPVDLERNLDGIDWTIVAEKVTDSSFHEPFTAAQCRIKWVGDKHPDIDHSDWPPLETQRLLSILKQDPTKPVDWAELSTQLGTHRTPLSLLSHGHPRQRHYWDHPSDARLLSGVALYGLNNWPLVARHVSPHATPTQALNRYTKSLDPSIKRGAWTPAEDARLRRAVAAAAAGSASASAKLPWVRIAEYVPGRTNDQCNERWTEHLSAAASEGGGKNAWTEEEDERLVELVGSMGKLWKAVSDKIGNGKTGPSCRARFNKLANKSKSSGYGTGTTTPASTSMSGLVALSPIPPTTSSATPSQPATTP
ncbi:MYB4R1, partial [Ephemerocybe angulata]